MLTNKPVVEMRTVPSILMTIKYWSKCSYPIKKHTTINNNLTKPIIDRNMICIERTRVGIESASHHLNIGGSRLVLCWLTIRICCVEVLMTEMCFMNAMFIFERDIVVADNVTIVRNIIAWIISLTSFGLTR